jgi:adenosylmethionine---8-amino-7-oxononanoate aminotransferase
MAQKYPKIWKPFTILQDASEPVKVLSGKGLYLSLENDSKVMDLISSWWVNLHGHAHPHIAGAIATQAQKLEHTIFADFTHDPAERLADAILDASDGVFQHVFFSDNGSTAVEVALKMATQYWQNKGESGRTSFIAFEGAYHGDTLGAMSAGSRSIFSEVFNHWLFDVHHAEYPSTWINDADVEEKEARSLSQIRQLLEQNPRKFAGIIIEPLVQGAGGMRMCRPIFLEKLQNLAREFDVLVIYDEVMTGFGRTGELFAFKKVGTQPDIICLSKGLTGGFMPMALTLTNSKVFETFYSDDALKTFWHGHSYTGNPLGCAAALASLELMDDARKTFSEMHNWHESLSAPLDELAIVKNRRICGTIAAFDIKTSDSDGYLNVISKTLKAQFLSKGMLVRPLGNVLYFMPPYCITKVELEEVYIRTHAILSEL